MRWQLPDFNISTRLGKNGQSRGVRKFVNWYNNIHQHSGINFVTPNARHNDEDQAILTKRIQIYELAKQKNPCRWSGKTRNWDRVDEVLLNTKRTARKVA